MFANAGLHRVLRSLQGKLIVIYLLLILVAMELTGLYLLRSLESYYLGSFRVGLTMHAQLLSGMVVRYLERDALEQPPGGAGLAKLAADFDPESGVSVAVLDATGRVLGASRRHSDLIGKLIRSDDISHALGGSTGESIGIDPDTRARTLFLAVPVRSGGQVLGVVYLKGSLERTYEILGNIRRIILYATLIALGITAIIGTLLARTITGPVREVTKRAAAMAQGDFEQTIQVRSGDEIGQLAAAFNGLTQQLKETLNAISGERNKLEAILAYMADGLVALDPGGRIIIMNGAAAAMLGAESDRCTGKTPAEVWPELPLPRLLDQSGAEGRPVTAEVVVGPDESGRRLLVHVTPLKGEKGSGAGAVLLLHDVTQLHQLETMRREFVANVSHELKTPLTTVKSYVETLLDGVHEDPALRDRFLNVVAAETDRMAKLVRDLLQLSELDQDMVQWDLRPCKLKDIVAEALVRLAGPLDRRQIRVSCHWEGDIPAVMVDRDKVHQVFANILANALEFSPEQGQVQIQVAHADPYVRVSVRDNGIGIPKADLPRIFERFYRVDKARSRMLGGTGLGLAIARQIVERLGGAIYLASEQGIGTVVTFTLPAAGAEGDDDQGQALPGGVSSAVVLREGQG